MRFDIASQGELFITAFLVVRRLVPESNLDIACIVPVVFDATLRADDGVVPPGIGGEVTLLIAGKDAVIQSHLHHAQVFDINGRIQTSLSSGRPEVRDAANLRFFFGLASIRDIAIHRQRAHGMDTLRVPATEQVNDVDVVSAFLQKQAVGKSTFSMPVFEVCFTAVGNEVANPDGFDLTDAPIIDELFISGS